MKVWLWRAKKKQERLGGDADTETSIKIWPRVSECKTKVRCVKGVCILFIQRSAVCLARFEGQKTPYATAA